MHGCSMACVGRGKSAFDAAQQRSKGASCVGHVMPVLRFPYLSSFPIFVGFREFLLCPDFCMPLQDHSLPR